jgi:hypothetical protein
MTFKYAAGPFTPITHPLGRTRIRAEKLPVLSYVSKLVLLESRSQLI